MTELKPYPKYKDSGVEWIGEVPEEWGFTKLKYISDIVMGQSPSAESINDKSKGLPFLQGNAEFTSIYPKPKHYSSEPKKISSKGNILLSVRAPVGAMNWSDTVYTIGRGLCSIKGNKLCTQNYLWFLLKCLKVELFSKMTGSTFEAVTITDVRESNVILPNILEQNKISEYLKHKTNEIDSLIADKENLIELLEEKRQAVITETVTKGLDPNVKMKDSGIEWIGEIPEHWEITRLKYLIELNPKKSEVKLKKNDLVSFIPLDKIIEPGVIDYSLTKRLEEVYNGYTYIRDNDIIMAKVTPSFENNNIAIANEMVNKVGFGTTEFHVLRAKYDIQIEYLYYLLQSESFRQAGISSMYGVAGLKRIPSEFILSYKIGIPDEREQEEIVNHLKHQNEEIDKLTKIQHRTISKLKEYRESLIFEAVTGKVDIRNYSKGGHLVESNYK